MQALLLVALGGALGSVARYLVGMITLRSLGPGWPYGTFTVNALGGFAIGALAAWLAFRGAASQERLRLLLQVGVLGGFTTFSAYSLDIAVMIERRAWTQAVAYGLSSVFTSLAAVFLGLIVVRKLVAA
ncbi:MAG TPA: fluoride efflux transporter CrcB [Phenylobacterium sp.]|nr:fluoride efflux transporter CrcB [Phenylobacterium sp.]